jgi:hypothetical protein
MKSIRKIPIREFKTYYNFIVSLLIFIFLNNAFAQEKLNWVDISLVDTIKYEQFNVDDVANSKYPPCNLFDSNLNTCWVSASNNSEESSLFLKLPDLNNIVINIFSGYGKSKELYLQNGRPKKIVFKFFSAVNPDGYVSEIGVQYKAVQFPQEQIVQLEDRFGVQSIPLDILNKDLADFSEMISKSFDSEFNLPKADLCLIVKMEIFDSFSGTRYDDICISEIFFNNRFIAFRPKNSNPISKVYLNKEENSLLLDEKINQGVVVYTDTSSVLQLIEVSVNKKWAILISMPLYIEGRVETNYLLADLVNKKIVNRQLQKVTGNYLSGNEMYFESRNNGRLDLIYKSKDGEYSQLELN